MEVSDAGELVCVAKPRERGKGLKRPEPPNGEKEGLNGVMKILREGPELKRQPTHERKERGERQEDRQPQAEGLPATTEGKTGNGKERRRKVSGD